MSKTGNENSAVLVATSGAQHWLLRTVRGPEPFQIEVFGAEIDVIYDEQHLVWVQIEFPIVEQEDPPPSGYWLPTALAHDSRDAERLTRILVDSADASIPSTSILMFPTAQDFGRP